VFSLRVDAPVSDVLFFYIQAVVGLISLAIAHMKAHISLAIAQMIV
jgi:hypothetical protein